MGIPPILLIAPKKPRDIYNREGFYFMAALCSDQERGRGFEMRMNRGHLAGDFGGVQSPERLSVALEHL